MERIGMANACLPDWIRKKKESGESWASWRKGAAEDLRAFQKIREDGSLLELAPESLQDNFEVVKFAVEQNGDNLRWASDRLVDDATVGGIVWCSVLNDGMALQYATEKCRDTAALVWSACQQNPRAVIFASERLRDDERLVSFCIRRWPNAINFASDRLCDTESVVSLACSLDGRMLLHASPRIRDSERVVSVAVQQSGSALLSASDRLRDSIAIVALAIEQDSRAIELASERLQELPELRNRAEAPEQTGARR
jgi:hypothetical protein